MKIHTQTHEDDIWIYGISKDTDDTSYFQPWMKLKKELWVSKNNVDKCKDWGFNVSDKLADRIFIFVDSQPSPTDDVLLYIYSCCFKLSDIETVINLITGPVMREMNNRKCSLHETIPSNIIRLFLELCSQDYIDKSMKKQFFEELLTGRNIWDCLADEKFIPASNNEILPIIEEVLLSNKDRIDKSNKDEKIINWLVGQVMKISRGKFSAELVKETLKKKIGD